MVNIFSPVELDTFETIQEAFKGPDHPSITICGGTGCRVLGSEKLSEAFREEFNRQNIQATLDFDIKTTGCHGFCEQGPLVVIRPSGIMYAHVAAKDVPEIVERTIIGGEIIDRLLYIDPQSGVKIEHEQDVPFYQFQQRVILDLNGLIDPQKIEEYIAEGGYTALQTVLSTMPPEQVIDEIKASGLRGRGGAGFPTGYKWELCR